LRRIVRYFDAFGQIGAPALSRAWEALFDRCTRAAKRGADPVRPGGHERPQHRDHLRINTIIANVEEQVKSSFSEKACVPR
jgi:hypothetical protein